ncbi:MAG TPA: hypothetical protein VIH81_08615, partial [Roseiarcus sp.]
MSVSDGPSICTSQLDSASALSSALEPVCVPLPLTETLGPLGVGKPLAVFPLALSVPGVVVMSPPPPPA